MTFTRGIGVVCGAIIDRIVRWLALSKIHPNVLTFFGLVINIWAAWLFSQGRFGSAGAVVIGAGLFDMVDGRVARATKQVTLFGGFFDSVLDRYTRARAENAIPKCKVGFLERPERVVLIIIGALFGRMAPVLWVIAVLSNLTVVHRMMYTWQECKRLELGAPTAGSVK